MVLLRGDVELMLLKEYEGKYIYGNSVKTGIYAQVALYPWMTNISCIFGMKIRYQPQISMLSVGVNNVELRTHLFPHFDIVFLYNIELVLVLNREGSPYPTLVTCDRPVGLNNLKQRDNPKP
jgi:hypothetical protein